MIGWFAVLIGCVYVALAFRLKTYKQPTWSPLLPSIMVAFTIPSRTGEFTLQFLQQGDQRRQLAAYWM